MDQPTITTRDPADLSIHPDARAMPEWSADDPRFEALVRDIRERGIDLPILIDAEGRIIVGIEHWKAAKRLQFASVQCKIVPELEIAAALLASILHRPHWTKSARAYLAYPLMKRAHEDARGRAIEKLKKGNVSPSDTQCLTGKKIDDFAQLMGVSRTLFKLAGEVHDLFARDPDYKRLMEPRILQDCEGGEHEDQRPVGLGAVKAGYEGRNKGGEHAGHTQLELFNKHVPGAVRMFTRWADMTEEQRAKAMKAIRENVALMEPECARESAELAAAIASEFRARAKETRE